jgi:rhodanese-related sulfurtransferase
VNLTFAEISIMKTYFFIFLISVSGLAVSCQTNADNSGGETQISRDLSPKEFSELSQSNPGLILDVRTSDEVRAAHLPGMTNIDITEGSFMDRIQQLDKEKPVYVYCAVGGRSANAAQKLKDLGFKEVYNLDGGIQAWIQNQLPVEK